MIESPCLNCPDRIPACSGKCEKFKAFAEEKEKEKAFLKSYRTDRVMSESFRRRCGFHKPK